MQGEETAENSGIGYARRSQSLRVKRLKPFPQNFAWNAILIVVEASPSSGSID